MSSVFLIFFIILLKKANIIDFLIDFINLFIDLINFYFKYPFSSNTKSLISAAFSKSSSFA
jgi:hypothetical protein